VLVLEPALAGGALKTSRKGIGQFELVVRGVAAHAGVDPRKGVNAIRELALQVLALDALRDLDRGVSVNVGLVSGGSRPNVVPDLATAHRRRPRADAGRRRGGSTAMRGLKAADARRVAGGDGRLQPAADGAVGRGGAPVRASRARWPPTWGSTWEGGTGGGSDGNFTAALGIPTLDGLGAVGDGAHALHEHVELAPRHARGPHRGRAAPPHERSRLVTDSP
jgi:glutamate carboxypeptidase